MPAFSFIDGLFGRLPPYFIRPAELQVAALCTRARRGRREVLLLSSLNSGRWILPKGWPMDGRSLAEAAGIEAWEEAGARGCVDPAPIGSYSYQKMHGNGLPLRCNVQIFAVSDVSLAESYPEAGRRRREWVSPQRAAHMVAEPELRALLAKL